MSNLRFPDIPEILESARSQLPPGQTGPAPEFVTYLVRPPNRSANSQHNLANLANEHDFSRGAFPVEGGLALSPLGDPQDAGFYAVRHRHRASAVLHSRFQGPPAPAPAPALDPAPVASDQSDDTSEPTCAGDMCTVSPAIERAQAAVRAQLEGLRLEEFLMPGWDSPLPQTPPETPPTKRRRPGFDGTGGRKNRRSPKKQLLGSPGSSTSSTSLVSSSSTSSPLAPPRPRGRPPKQNATPGPSNIHRNPTPGPSNIPRNPTPGPSNMPRNATPGPSSPQTPLSSGSIYVPSSSTGHPSSPDVPLNVRRSARVSSRAPQSPFTPPKPQGHLPNTPSPLRKLVRFDSRATVLENSDDNDNANFNIPPRARSPGDGGAH